MIIESYKAEDTFEIGRRLGETAKSGDVLSLCDLGTGKTVY